MKLHFVFLYLGQSPILKLLAAWKSQMCPRIDVPQENDADNQGAVALEQRDNKQWLPTEDL